MNHIADDRDILRRLVVDIMKWNARPERFGEDYRSPDGRQFLFIYPDGSPYILKHEGWNPLERYEDVAQVREEIGKWYSLRGDFLTALSNEVGGSFYNSDDDHWKLIHATPRQQCMAAIAALGTANENPESHKSTPEAK